MANKDRHAWLEVAQKIEGFKAAGPRTFVLRLNSPYYPTLDDLSLPRPFRFLSPAAFPENGITRDGIRKAIGTGPWTLSETRLGEYDRFERNDAYWGAKPKPSGVLVRVIPDPISRVMALQTGEIDLIYGQGQATFDAFDALRRDPAYVTAISSPIGTMAAAINSTRGPTTDLAVRKAIQHLVDKGELIRGVFLDTQPVADTLFPPTVPYCDIDLDAYAYDPERATRFLDEAGWKLPAKGGIRERNGEPLVIDFCFVGNDAAHKALAEVLQGQAAKVGMLLNLVGEEEDSFFRRQKDGNFGMIINTTWGPPFEPHAMLGSMRKPSHADYQAQSGLPMKAELDADITAALATVDEGARGELYRKILTTLHEQAVYLPINYVAFLAAYKKGRLEGFHFGPGKSKFPFEDFDKR
jgi:nickel transport system substrate-binding protein